MASNESKISYPKQNTDSNSTNSRTPPKPVQALEGAENTHVGIVNKPTPDTGQSGPVESKQEHPVPANVAKEPANGMSDVVLAPGNTQPQQTDTTFQLLETEPKQPVHESNTVDTNPVVIPDEPVTIMTSQDTGSTLVDSQPVVTAVVMKPNEQTQKQEGVSATKSDPSSEMIPDSDQNIGQSQELVTTPALSKPEEPVSMEVDVDLKVTDPSPMLTSENPVSTPILVADNPVLQMLEPDNPVSIPILVTDIPIPTPIVAAENPIPTPIVAAENPIPTPIVAAENPAPIPLLEPDNPVAAPTVVEVPSTIPIVAEKSIPTIPAPIVTEDSTPAPIVESDNPIPAPSLVSDNAISIETDIKLRETEKVVSMHTEEQLNECTDSVQSTAIIKSQEQTQADDVEHKVLPQTTNIVKLSEQIQIPVMDSQTENAINSGDPSLIIPVVHPTPLPGTTSQEMRELNPPDTTVTTSMDVTSQDETGSNLPQPVHEVVLSLVSDIIQPADVIMHTKGEVTATEANSQQKRTESAVMDVPTELPQQLAEQIPIQADSESNQGQVDVLIPEPHPVLPCTPPQSEVMAVDPSMVPLPVESGSSDFTSMEMGEKTPEYPTQILNVPIDTIVIADSPQSSVSYGDQMEVIDLISDESPPCSPSHAKSTSTPPSKRSKISLSSDLDQISGISGPASSHLNLSLDLELLELLINSCDMLGGITVEDQKICFSYQHKGVCISSTLICIEDDYPQVTLIVSSKQGEKSDILSKRLPCIAWEVLTDCCEKQGVSPPLLTSLPAPLCELLQSQTPYITQTSSQSNASQTSNCTDGDDEDFEATDDDDDDNEFGEVDEEVTMHPLLERDIDRVRLKYGKDAIETRNYGGIGDMDIDLIIDMNFLEPEIARAWGVKHTVPLVVRLSLSAEHYLDGADMKVEVFQEDRGNTKGICKQMEKIISQFISTGVKAAKNPLCNTKVEDAVDAYNNLEQRLVQNRRAIAKTGGAGSEKKGMLAQFMGKFHKDKQVDFDQLIAQLVEMGWETELAVHALQRCNMDLERALDFLSDENEKDADESDEDNPKSLVREKSRGAEVLGLDWMSDIADTNEAAMKSKQPPPLSHGFLCQVIQYILNRIPTLNDFCVICDETHLFSNGAMLKPTVCARELCSFAFQTLGVMADVADSIATGPEVVELLVAMCNAASLSNRREDILEPYPTVVDPNNPRQFALHPKEKDFKKVEKAIGFVVQELKALPAVLKERLDSLDVHSFPLLQWILASNRCHIVKLTAERQIKSMGTTHQFLLLSAPPAKEATFRKLKQKHKSIYAFHGSRLENWHSIMRNGLLNASGTKFQLHGAAYGAGIYLSPHASVSFGYSGIHGGGKTQTDKKKGRPTMLSSQNLNCIALCEVIDSKIKKSGNIWVLTEADHVVTRFFFVYEDNTTGDTNFDTREDKYIKEIENAVKSLL